jgi:hypothetical protein
MASYILGTNPKLLGLFHKTLHELILAFLFTPLSPLSIMLRYIGFLSAHEIFQSCSDFRGSVIA